MGAKKRSKPSDPAAKKAATARNKAARAARIARSLAKAVAGRKSSTAGEMRDQKQMTLAHELAGEGYDVYAANAAIAEAYRILSKKRADNRAAASGLRQARAMFAGRA